MHKKALKVMTEELKILIRSTAIAPIVTCMIRTYGIYT